MSPEKPKKPILPGEEFIYTEANVKELNKGIEQGQVEELAKKAKREAEDELRDSQSHDQKK